MRLLEQQEFKDAIRKLENKLAQERDMANLPKNFFKKDVEVRIEAIRIVKEWIAEAFMYSTIEDMPIDDGMYDNLFKTKSDTQASE